jgi:hypothetical protein
MTFLKDQTPACSTIGDKDYFFPEGKKELREHLAIAKKICASCPVLSACTSYAQNTPGLMGIWAGKYYDGAGYVSPAILLRKTA